MGDRLLSRDLDGNDIPADVVQNEAMSLMERYPVGCLQITAETPPEQWPTSMVKGSPKWKATIVNACWASDIEATLEWSEPFTVMEWLVMVRTDFDDKTGDVRLYPWLVLVTDDGRLVGTSSKYAPHGLSRALRVFTEEDWKQGVQFQIRKRPNKAGDRAYHQLRVVE